MVFDHHRIALSVFLKIVFRVGQGALPYVSRNSSIKNLVHLYVFSFFFLFFIPFFFFSGGLRSAPSSES